MAVVLLLLLRNTAGNECWCHLPALLGFAMLSPTYGLLIIAVYDFLMVHGMHHTWLIHYSRCNTDLTHDFLLLPQHWQPVASATRRLRRNSSSLTAVFKDFSSPIHNSRFDSHIKGLMIIHNSFVLLLYHSNWAVKEEKSDTSLTIANNAIVPKKSYIYRF